MRLSAPLKESLGAALRQSAATGARIRFCYDGDKPVNPNLAAGQDPAPPGTGEMVQGLGYPSRRIAGQKLMRDKFIVRDRHADWVADSYARDFEHARRAPPGGSSRSGWRIRSHPDGGRLPAMDNGAVESLGNSRAP
jgi:hypothetical protein